MANMSVTRIAGRYLLGRGHIEVKEVAFKGKGGYTACFTKTLILDIRPKTGRVNKICLFFSVTAALDSIKN